MKKIFMAFSLAALAAVMVNAQNQSGVYLSRSDFENNNLTYATRGVSEVNKIHFNEFFVKPYIVVKHNGEKLQIFKDEIFAYMNKGKVVHTWNYTQYNFIEKGPLWIYYKDVYASQTRGIKKERKYFYSSGNGIIYPLTIDNLKRSFPDNRLFHILLDAVFRSDDDLSSYDGFAKKLKLNYLLETAIAAVARN